MRLLARVFTAIAVVAFPVAAIWAYLARNDASAPLPVILFAIATVATLAATACWVLAERNRAGLAIPDERRGAGHRAGDRPRLPAPAWWAPVGAAGLLDLAAWPVSLPVAVVGGALVLVAAFALARDVRHRQGGEPPVLDRGTVRAARQIQAFGTRHAADGDASVDAVVEHLGVPGAKIVVVGRDGGWGDLVVRSPERAALAVKLAGARVHDTFPPDLVGRIRTGRYEWTRMAGIQLGG